jgi:hypothetical protein
VNADAHRLRRACHLSIRRFSHGGQQDVRATFDWHERRMPKCFRQIPQRHSMRKSITNSSDRPNSETRQKRTVFWYAARPWMISSCAHRTNPYMASGVKRAHGYCPVYLGFLDLFRSDGCVRDDADRNGSLTARAILTCGYVTPIGVTHSNPYQTVGPGPHEAGRDGGTNGNNVILCRMPRRRSTSVP